MDVSLAGGVDKLVFKCMISSAPTSLALRPGLDFVSACLA